MRAAAILVGVIMAATPSHVVAETSWVSVGTSENTLVEVDNSRIKKTGNIIRYWKKTTIKNPKDDWKYTIAMAEDDCVNAKTRNIQIVVYLKSGKIQMASGDGNWDFVTPDSMQEVINEFVCAM